MSVHSVVRDKAVSDPNRFSVKEEYEEVPRWSTL
jgi:hypothetical protein